MKKRIRLLGKKLKKRLEQKKYKSHYTNLKKFEKLMCDKYHCGVDDDLFESLNHKEIRHHETLTHICITNDMLKATKLIQKYIGITHKNDIFFISFFCK